MFNYQLYVVSRSLKVFATICQRIIALCTQKCYNSRSDTEATAANFECFLIVLGKLQSSSNILNVIRQNVT